MKNILKKISLFVCILVCCVILTGCGAEYNIILKDNGLIETNITVDLTGLPDDQFDKVSSALSIYYGQLDKAFEENTAELYSNVYNYEELNLTTNYSKVTYILNTNGYIVNDSEIQKLGKKVFFKKSFYSINKSLSRSLGAYYLYFYPSALEYSEEESDIVLKNSYVSLMDDVPFASTLTLEEAAFSAKYIQQCNPLYYNGEEPKFLYDVPVLSISAGTTLKDYITNITGLDETQLNLVFNFTTPYNRVHSNGTVTQKGNVTTHSWQLNSVDSCVTFYRKVARPMWWYVICAGVSLLILTGGIVAGVVINNRKKKVGLEALKKIDDLMNNPTNKK